MKNLEKVVLIPFFDVNDVQKSACYHFSHTPIPTIISIRKYNKNVPIIVIDYTNRNDFNFKYNWGSWCKKYKFRVFNFKQYINKFNHCYYKDVSRHSNFKSLIAYLFFLLNEEKIKQYILMDTNVICFENVDHLFNTYNKNTLYIRPNNAGLEICNPFINLSKFKEKMRSWGNAALYHMVFGGENKLTIDNYWIEKSKQLRYSDSHKSGTAGEELTLNNLKAQDVSFYGIIKDSDHHIAEYRDISLYKWDGDNLFYNGEKINFLHTLRSSYNNEWCKCFVDLFSKVIDLKEYLNDGDFIKEFYKFNEIDVPFSNKFSEIKIFSGKNFEKFKKYIPINFKSVNIFNWILCFSYLRRRNIESIAVIGDENKEFVESLNNLPTVKTIELFNNVKSKNTFDCLILTRKNIDISAFSLLNNFGIILLVGKKEFNENKFYEWCENEISEAYLEINACGHDISCIFVDKNIKKKLIHFFQLSTSEFL